MEDYKEKIIADGKFARIVALISFVMGTIILVLFKITKESTFIYIGLIYVLMALFLNFILFINLFYNLFIYKKMYRYQLGNMAIVLLNIPITLFYLKITF